MLKTGLPGSGRFEEIKILVRSQEGKLGASCLAACCNQPGVNFKKLSSAWVESYRSAIEKLSWSIFETAEEKRQKRWWGLSRWFNAKKERPPVRWRQVAVAGEVFTLNEDLLTRLRRLEALLISYNHSLQTGVEYALDPENETPILGRGLLFVKDEETREIYYVAIVDRHVIADS